MSATASLDNVLEFDASAMELQMDACPADVPLHASVGEHFQGSLGQPGTNALYSQAMLIFNAMLQHTQWQ